MIGLQQLAHAVEVIAVPQSFVAKLLKKSDSKVA